MLTLIKWLGGFILTITLLILAAVIVVPMVVDPNDFREDIAALVKDKTGRDLQLAGDLKPSVFPWLGVRTEGLTLSQPEAIGGDMLSVKTAQLRVKLLPLLSKRVEVDTVVLEQPLIRLVTLKNGTDSFAGLGDDSDDESSDDSDAPAAAVALVIQGLELTDGNIIIDDRQEDTRREISELNLVTGNLIGDQLASIKASGRMQESGSPDVTQFELNGEARIDVDSLALSARNLAADVLHGEHNLTLGFDDLSFTQSQQVDVKGLKVTVNGQQEVDLSIPDLSANIENQTASAALISVSASGLNAKVQNLQASKIIDQPSATGSINVEQFDATKLIKSFEIDFVPSDPSVLKAVALNADFSGGLDGAGVKNLVLSLDQSRLTGSASVSNYENPKIKFNLALDEFDVDRYLPEVEEGSDEDEVSGGEALAVPMALFKDIHANGNFKAKRLVSGGVALTDIDVVVASQPGSVTITPKANLYEGTLDGSIAFQERDGKAQLKVKNEIDLVQLGDMLNAAEVTDQLSGLGTLALDLLVTEQNGVQRNKGTIKLFAKDGELKGVDIENIVGKANGALGLIKGLGSKASSDDAAVEVQAEKADTTKFAELLGTFYLDDFLITNDDFKLKAPALTVTGAGEIDMANETINYLINVAVDDNVAGALGQQLGKLQGKSIPVRCKGKFEAMSCLPDAKAIYALYVNTKLDEKKGEFLQEKLGIEGGEKLSTKDVLKQVLIQKATKADKRDRNVERPITDTGAAQQQAADSSSSQDSAIPDVSAEPDEAVETKPLTKKERREERKRKILESIFN